jgi:heme/copper-type cytochrome/quinol oxidase subunit 2
MQNDTISYDTLENRPLPKWLTDQKSGLNTIQPQKITLREDNSLKTSFIATSVFILVVIALLTVYVLRKHKEQV